MTAYAHLDRLIADAQALRPMPGVAVVFPCDASSLGSSIAMQEHGVGHPVLVGPPARLHAVARASNIDLSSTRICPSGDDPVHAALAALELLRNREVHALMKGSLHTDELLAPVVREKGLRTGRRLSHVFVFDIPGRQHPLLMTDCVVNIQPTLEQKRDIAQNAIDAARRLGISRPKIAVLSATESVNPAISSSVEAALLAKMAERGQIVGGEVDGPLAMDIALSRDSAVAKGLKSDVAGSADILLLPDLTAGNILYKALVYLGGAACAGVVLGAAAPIVVTSRADSPFVRLASAALAIKLLDPRP